MYVQSEARSFLYIFVSGEVNIRVLNSSYLKCTGISYVSFDFELSKPGTLDCVLINHSEKGMITVLQGANFPKLLIRKISLQNNYPKANVGKFGCFVLAGAESARRSSSN